MEFNPINFVKSLQYMGIGMLGVFMIIGIIIGATYLIGYATGKIANKNSEDN